MTAAATGCDWSGAPAAPPGFVAPLLSEFCPSATLFDGDFVGDPGVPEPTASSGLPSSAGVESLPAALLLRAGSDWLGALTGFASLFWPALASLAEPAAAVAGWLAFGVAALLSVVSAAVLASRAVFRAAAWNLASFAAWAPADFAFVPLVAVSDAIEPCVPAAAVAAPPDGWAASAPEAIFVTAAAVDPSPDGWAAGGALWSACEPLVASGAVVPLCIAAL